MRVVKYSNHISSGIVKGIKKAVGGIGKAIGGVGKAVSGVLSNPIVGAVASFIPGAAPIVAGVQGIAGLMSGDPIGAALGAASFIPGVGGFVDKAIGFLDSPRYCSKYLQWYLWSSTYWWSQYDQPCFGYCFSSNGRKLYGCCTKWFGYD